MAREFKWVLSNEILTEYEEQVTRRYFMRTVQQVHGVLTTAPDAYFQETCYKCQIIKADLDDNKFVDVAIATNVDWLVTNDKYFDILKQLESPRVPIVSFQLFLKDF